MSASSLSPVRRALPDDVGSIEGALAEAGPTVVALSGGVDSSVMALLLRRALGDRAFAATLAGPAVSRREIDRATEVARWIGISHEVVEADPLAVEGYRTNPSNRCYFCRSVEGQAILRWAGPRGIRSFVDGIHRDDLTDDRPGIRALEEVGFRHPLAEAAWGKAEVRAFARTAGLPNAEEPSNACLASRVRRGQPITRELLERVGRAEEFLLARGFRRVRVRTDGSGARVEVDPSEVPRLLAEPFANEVQRELTGLGFDPVALDPRGYGGRPSA